jgi:hypothetical protein
MTSPIRSRRRSASTGRRLRRLLLGAVVVTVAGLVVWWFVAERGETDNEVERDRPAVAASRIVETDGQTAVKLDVQTREKNGIEVAELLAAPYQDRVRGYGSVLDLSQLTGLANSYANARAQLQMAQAKRAVSKTAFERAQGLYRNQQNVSLAQVQAAEAALQTDEATLTAADAQVRALAATVQQNFGPIIGQSLLDGSSLVTRLIEQRDFLLQVTLPPGVTLPSPPKEATLELEGGTSATISLVSLAARTDPRIQGMSFLYLVSATSLVLPGMNLLVSLPSGLPGDGVAIPPSAIVWWQDRAWIYRQSGTDLFVRTEVPTILPTPNGGYVVKDLPKGTTIVTQGAQLLLSEEFRAQIRVEGD